MLCISARNSYPVQSLVEVSITFLLCRKCHRARDIYSKIIWSIFARICSNQTVIWAFLRVSLNYCPMHKYNSHNYLLPYGALNEAVDGLTGHWVQLVVYIYKLASVCTWNRTPRFIPNHFTLPQISVNGTNEFAFRTFGNALYLSEMTYALRLEYKLINTLHFYTEQGIKYLYSVEHVVGVPVSLRRSVQLVQSTRPVWEDTAEKCFITCNVHARISPVTITQIKGMPHNYGVLLTVPWLPLIVVFWACIE